MALSCLPNIIKYIPELIKMKSRKQTEADWQATWKTKLKEGTMEPNMASALALLSIRTTLLDIRDILAQDARIEYEPDEETEVELATPPSDWQHAKFYNE